MDGFEMVNEIPLEKKEEMLEKNEKRKEELRRQIEEVRKKLHAASTEFQQLQNVRDTQEKMLVVLRTEKIEKEEELDRTMHFERTLRSQELDTAERLSIRHVGANLTEEKVWEELLKAKYELKSRKEQLAKEKEEKEQRQAEEPQPMENQ